MYDSGTGEPGRSSPSSGLDLDVLENSLRELYKLLKLYYYPSIRSGKPFHIVQIGYNQV